MNLKKKLNKKGFTLAELLIVVAIIAVLVAVSIPIFTTQLEKAREATDLANIRAAYAEAMVDLLDNNGEGGDAQSVKMVQTTSGWDHVTAEIAGDDTIDVPDVEAGDTVTVTVSDAGVVTITVD